MKLVGVKVTIRCYGELNDLLPAGRRQRDVGVEVAVGPSVKDAVEALGIPHTEIDLVLVDGEPVGFDHRLADGQRVSVYPPFQNLDISELTRVRPEPWRPVRFAADGHLAALARYLRLVGFDTWCDPQAPDAVVAARASAERRVVLTRDRGLLKRRTVTHGLLVRHDRPDDQLAEVVSRLNLHDTLQPFTRCMVCNGRLHDVDAAEVADRLPPRVRAVFERFRQCRRCGRVYWEGSHHRRLEALVRRADAARAG